MDSTKTRLYQVMEYGRGQPLGVLCSRAERAGKAVPIGVLMRILADTCAGLHAAHELTRDGKPLGVVQQGLRARLERQRIVDALQKTGGNQTQAAELLGLPRGRSPTG